MKRRNFVAKSSLSGLAALLGVDIIYKKFMPLGYTPVALQESDPFKLFNKDKGMVVLNDKPWNIEAQAHLLDDRVTPNKSIFVRNNGLIPEDIDVDTWTLTIDGESVKQEKTSTLSELKSKFK